VLNQAFNEDYNMGSAICVPFVSKNTNFERFSDYYLKTGPEFSNFITIR